MPILFSIRSSFSLIMCLLVTACANFAPDYHRPQIETPAAWREQTDKAAQIDNNWWQTFNSVDLNHFLQTAQANNIDIGASLQRIEQARAQIQINRATLFPTADANGNISNNDTNNTNAIRSLGGGVSLSYELDLWGRNRNAVAAAQHDLIASIYDTDALRLTVSGDTAQSYFNVLTLQARISKAEDNLKLSQDVLNIIQTRFHEGAASGQDVAQQNTAIATQQATLLTLRQQKANALSQLNVLQGRTPQNAIDLSNPNAFDTLVVPAIAPLQPADLLERRPDLARLEEQLKAANLDIGIARANFFPTVSLGLDASFSRTPISGLFRGATGLVGRVTAPLFTGGRLQGELNATTAQQKELVENYRGAVLTAFQEAENALSAVKAATEREAALKTARDESNRYYSIARERYRSGADDFLTLLDAQRTLLQAEDTYLQARLDQLTAAIALFKAMGGGWSSNATAQASIDRQ